MNRGGERYVGRGDIEESEGPVLGHDPAEESPKESETREGHVGEALQRPPLHEFRGR